jgi:flavodoxin I
MDLTSNKAIFYYSMTGNTKALVELCDTTGFEVFNLNKLNIEEINFDPFQTILIGTSTVGDGVPHEIFRNLAPKLKELKDKNIGLFGSGNSIYPHYCGALDLLADLLKKNNKMLFVFKFESYPTKYAVTEFQSILDSIRR